MSNFPGLDDFLCKDRRVYVVIDLANAVLAGNTFSAEQRERFKDFPNTLVLLDWMAEARTQGLRRVSATPGPEATPETFSAEWLRSLKEQREDVCEEAPLPAPRTGG